MRVTNVCTMWRLNSALPRWSVRGSAACAAELGGLRDAVGSRAAAPTSDCAASAASMVEPPTPVSAMPARVIDPPRAFEGDRDAGGGEVADAALELEVAAGGLALRRGDHRLDRDLVVGEHVLERAR